MVSCAFAWRWEFLTGRSIARSWRTARTTTDGGVNSGCRKAAVIFIRIDAAGAADSLRGGWQATELSRPLASESDGQQWAAAPDAAGVVPITMQPLATSKLFIHRNTLEYRLSHFELTGLDLSSFDSDRLLRCIWRCSWMNSDG